MSTPPNAGLKAQNHRNFQMATYMIVAQLSTRTVFAPKLLSTLVKAIAKNATEGTLWTPDYAVFLPMNIS
jgi:hypothetical protein